MTDRYYFTQFPTIGQWGPKTRRASGDSGNVVWLHYRVDLEPKSCVSSSAPFLILGKDFSKSLNECTGIVVHEGLFEPSEIYRQLYGQKHLPDLLWAEVTGVAHKDDFGLERGTRKIVSEKVKRLIEAFPHEGISFKEGSAPSDEEIERELFENARRLVEATRAQRAKQNSDR